MVLSRKDFLLSTAGIFMVGGGLARNGFTNPVAIKPLGSTEMSILYDSSKCIGCRHCEEGCRKENDLPKGEEPGELSESVFTAIHATKNGNKKNLFLKLQCMHCTDASCVSVCPTGAAAHQGEYVVIDQDVCMGCGYCEEACPFGVPHKAEAPQGTAKKCTFCFDHVQSGLNPCCVNSCPTNATTYGANTDQLTIAKNRVQVLKKTGWPEAQLYGEDELGGLHVKYILLKPPTFYGLPEHPRQATGNVLKQWGSGSLVAAAIIAPIWYLHHRMTEKDKKSTKEKGGTK